MFFRILLTAISKFDTKYETTTSNNFQQNDDQISISKY